MIEFESRIDGPATGHSWGELDSLHKKLVNQNPFPVILCSVDGEIRYANKPASDLLNLSRLSSVFDLPFLSKENEMVSKEQNPILKAIERGSSSFSDSIGIVTNNEISIHRLQIDVPESPESLCLVNALLGTFVTPCFKSS